MAVRVGMGFDVHAFSGAPDRPLVLGGVRPTVEGMADLPAGGYVLVANHASILDGLVLAAVLPGPLVFPAAVELASARVAGPFLRRIGAVFVDRADRKEAAAASRRLLEAAHGGAVLAFFPEGTMSRVPGLHPFRMGAFVVSEEAGLPLVPVALRGTGRILRGDRRFPRYGRIEVSITAPLSEPKTVTLTSLNTTFVFCPPLTVTAWLALL